MSQTYKGFTIPSYTDAGDAPKAFQDFADSLEAAMPDELPDQTGRAARQLITDGTTASWGPKHSIQTTVPTSGGEPGDVIYVVAP